MASMLDAVRELVTPSLLSRMSAHTGDSEPALSRGFGAAIPLLFAALANKSDDHTFINQVANIATDSANDPDVPATLPRAVGGLSGIDTTTPAGGWLSRLFGGNLTDVVDGVNRYAGVSRGTSASLLSLAAPLILGYLGRMMFRDGLNAVGLADKLRGHRGVFAAAVPTELAALIPGIARAPVETGRVMDRDIGHREEALRVAAAVDRTRGWMLPALLVALALGGLFWLTGREHRRADTRASYEVTRPVAKAPEKSRAVGTTGERAAPSIPVATPAPRFEIEKTVRFKTGSSSLNGQARAEFASVTAALKSHPDARVEINGYTDNVGSEATNVALSRSRATAVMNSLHEMGIPTDRMQAEGLGSQDPIASNATREGQAQNRRVVVMVTER
jgi:OmpA-OmpF porin, OOP family